MIMIIIGDQSGVEEETAMIVVTLGVLIGVENKTAMIQMEIGEVIGAGPQRILDTNIMIFAMILKAIGLITGADLLIATTVVELGKKVGVERGPATIDLDFGTLNGVESTPTLREFKENRRNVDLIL